MSNGLKPLPFERFPVAPCSIKNFTMSKCPCFAAMCNGVFFKLCVCSFTSWPALIKFLTMSKSPFLHDLQISTKRCNFDTTYVRRLSCNHRLCKGWKQVCFEWFASLLTHHCRPPTSEADCKFWGGRCRQHSEGVTNCVHLKHRCSPRSAIAWVMSLPNPSCMQGAVECIYFHLTIQLLLNAAKELLWLPCGCSLPPCVMESCFCCYRH